MERTHGAVEPGCHHRPIQTVFPLVPVAHGNPGAPFALSSSFSPSEHRVSNLVKLESLLPAPRLSHLGFGMASLHTLS